MPLQLEIVSEHRDLVGDDAVREFHENGGTIGRSLQNDWILPDPEKYISSRHATIDYKGGMYYLMDTSTNGVYINEEVEPVGKGNPRRLFNGDRLRLGSFELVVRLDSGESLDIPLDTMSDAVALDIESMEEAESLRTGMKLLDEEELTGDAEFQSTLFGGNNVTSLAVADRPKAEPAPGPKTQPAAKTPDFNRSVREAVSKLDKIANGDVEASADDLFESFLAGLGIDRNDLHPAIDLAEVMQNTGHILREFIDGTISLLTSRAGLKNTFRLDQTSVLPRHNNPLKLSQNSDELIKQLLVGRDGEYLSGQNAVREVCRDLLFHQNAFLDAMTFAFAEFAERFDPDELEDGFNHTPPEGLVAKMLGKTNYWDLYRELYPILTEKGNDRFPQLFGEDFVKAYEKQIIDLQRSDQSENNSMTVQELSADSEEFASLTDTLTFKTRRQPTSTETNTTIAAKAENDDLM